MRASLVRLGLILTAAGMVLAERGGASELFTSGSGLAASRSANPNSSSQQAQQTSETCTFDVECEDGNPCTTDRCIIVPEMPPGSGKCAHDPVTPGEPGGCDDGVFCNGRELCDDQGQCAWFIPVTCCSSSDPIEVCHETAGRCRDSSLSPGRSCATDADCAGGTCGHCQPKCTQNGDCDDGQSCNGMETCNVATGICHGSQVTSTCDTSYCGDSMTQASLGEECDGTDDAVCPGACMPPGHNQACKCCVSACGNGAVECLEECDGFNDGRCPGMCFPGGTEGECSCGSNCGNDFREPDEDCDGTDDGACPGRCQADCACPPKKCGNGIRDQGEECDGTDDFSCQPLGGLCRPPGDPAGECTCTCGAVPDEFWPMAFADPSRTLKNRYLAFGITNQANWTEVFGLRVQLTSLEGFGTQLGYRFVNLLEQGECSDAPDLGSTFRCAELTCVPEYRNWAGELAEEVVYVTGDSVIPNSVYHVVLMAQSCQGQETTCPAVSKSLELATAEWGDVNGDGSVNVVDVSNEVDVLKAVPTGHLPKYHAQVQPNEPDPSMPVSVSDLANVVDALKGFAYPFAGPTPCP